MAPKDGSSPRGSWAGTIWELDHLRQPAKTPELSESRTASRWACFVRRRLRLREIEVLARVTGQAHRKRGMEERSASPATLQGCSGL